MTLNSESGEEEWQLPSSMQSFDNSELSSEMFKIVLEDGSEFSVSDKHKVYSSELDNTDKSNIRNYLMLIVGVLSLCIGIVILSKSSYGERKNEKR